MTEPSEAVGVCQSCEADIPRSNWTIYESCWVREGHVCLVCGTPLASFADGHVSCPREPEHDLLDHEVGGTAPAG